MLYKKEKRKKKKKKLTMYVNIFSIKKEKKINAILVYICQLKNKYIFPTTLYIV